MMNPDEKKLLTKFLAQLENIRGLAKDPEAEQLIARAAQIQPDALYLLVQKALLQEQGLRAAQARIEQLEDQLRRARNSGLTAAPGGFLGHDPWAQHPTTTGSAPLLRAGQPASGTGANPLPGSTPMGGGFGSFLGAAAATAAGVAGGAFLFHGLESLLGQHPGAGHGLSEASPQDAHMAPENVTINHYYGGDMSPAGQEAGFDNRLGEDSPASLDDWAVDGDINSLDV